MERFRSRMSGWSGNAPDPDDPRIPLADLSAPEPSAASWQANEDDEAEHIGPPTSVWRVQGDRATSIDVGGELAALATGEGRVVAVCQLPSDPLIKAVQPGGYLSYIRPATVLVGDGRSFTAVGSVAESSGVIVVDGHEAWLLGFNRRSDDDMTEVQRVDLASGALSLSARSDAEVVAVARGRLLTLGWDRERGAPDGDDEAAPARVVRIAGSAGEASTELPIPDIDDANAAVDGPVVWFRVVGRTGFVAIDVEARTAREVTVDIDCTEFVPSVSVPDDLDPVAFESSQVDGLRAAFYGGWRSESGERHSFIQGVDFDTVEVEGSFPHTAVVGLFRAANRPGTQFGRRWTLYDDLGNPRPLEYAAIHLMEHIEAVNYGLPPLDECLPDDDGIVWF